MEPTVTDQTAGVVTYRVVKIEACEDADYCGEPSIPRCVGCNGDGTRMVDVAEVEPAHPNPDQPGFMWVEVES